MTNIQLEVKRCEGSTYDLEYLGPRTCQEKVLYRPRHRIERATF